MSYLDDETNGGGKGKVALSMAAALGFAALGLAAYQSQAGSGEAPAEEAKLPPATDGAKGLQGQSGAEEQYRATVSDGVEPVRAQEIRIEPEAQYDHQPIDRFIEFRTDDAERIVRTVDIACPQPGKSIHLMDLLRRAAREGSFNKDAGLYATVESRGDEVRVYHQMRLADGRSNEPHLVMSMDQWGDLRLFGIREEAVMMQCYM